jgi:hypothetical protein
MKLKRSRCPMLFKLDWPTRKLLVALAKERKCTMTAVVHQAIQALAKKN